MQCRDLARRTNKRCQRDAGPDGFCELETHNRPIFPPAENGGTEPPEPDGSETPDQVNGTGELARHDGPGAEPAAVVPDADGQDLSRLDGLADDLFGDRIEPDPSAQPSPERSTNGGPPAPAPAVGPWEASDVAEILDGTVHPFLRTRGVQTPGRDGVYYVSEKAASCLNIVAHKIDPNNPAGALALALLTVYGFPLARALRGRDRPAPETSEVNEDTSDDPDPPAASGQANENPAAQETGLEAQAMVRLGAE